MLRYFTVLLLLATNYAHAQTSMFRAVQEHTGVYADNGHAVLGAISWKYQTSGKIFSSPAVCHGVVYIGSEDHYLYAIDEHSGKLLWKFETGGAVHSSPAVYNGTVFFGSFDGFYYAVNCVNGKLVWKFKTGGEKRVGARGLWTMKPVNTYMDDPFDFFLSSPVVAPDTKNPVVYFGSSDGNVYALNANNGRKLWAFKTNGVVHTSPALYKGKLYFGSWDTYLYALDAKTGKLAWKFETGKQPVYHLLEGIQGSPACAGGLVFTGARDGFLYALDAASGKLKWKYDAKGSWVITTPAIKNNVVYATTSDTYLFLGLDAQTGKVKLQYKTNGYNYSSPAIAGSIAYFGDFTGNFYSVDITSGKLTGKFSTPARLTNAKNVLDPEGNIDFAYMTKGKDLAFYATTVFGMNKLYKLGPIVSSPAIDNGVVFFGSADGCLYALTLK
ncbi:MAG: PQQ-binding-like beta-propeller repeat protein [Bacteroidetes bacterium]|nr:PQQ-binding-like beta-propeller repeat protein [Bacteroidota bacterium]